MWLLKEVEVFVSTDCTNDVLTANWTNVTSQVDQIATSNQQGQTDLNSFLDISDFSNRNFALAFKYTSSNSTHSSINRNGTFYISDVKYLVSSTTLSKVSVEVENGISVYVNPFSLELNIFNLCGRYNAMELLDMFGRRVFASSLLGKSRRNMGVHWSEKLRESIF